MLRRFRLGLLICILLVLILVLLGCISIVPYWLIVIPVAVLTAWLIYGASVMSADVFVKSFCKSHKTTDAIALTFDDGPIEGHTEKILDILKAYRLQAVFFCIGKKLKAHPLLAKRILEEGHLIANHSYYHEHMFSLQSTQTIVDELKRTETEIRKISGYRCRWFRPPYGVTNPMIAKAVYECDYKSIGWSVRSFDTRITDVDELFNRVSKPLKAGDIVLFHDNGKCTAEVLPRFLDFVKKSGLKIERADTLLDQKIWF